MLREHEVFLLSPAPHSVDSRSCGLVLRTAMPGKATHLWRWDMPDDSLPIMLSIAFVVGGGLWAFMLTGAAPWGTLIVVLGGFLLGGGLAVWGCLSILRRARKG